MKKKSIKHRILKGILVFLIVIISLVLIINIPITHITNQRTEEDYSSWMSETLSNEQRVVDVAMLGAHDALTNEINIFSRLDPYETNSIMQGFTGLLVKGFIFRQSKTQVDDVSILLDSGVRYLDIRLTYDDEKWYTKHNYISGDFLPIVDQIKSFLDKNSGEFLILDFQHISGLDYADSEDYQTFYDMLDESGILDYAYNNADLNTLTYGALTNNGQESKVLITSKFVDSSGKVLQYSDNVRSEWADSDDFDYIFEFLEDEAAAVEDGGINNRFRVMQGVATMQMNGSGILKALSSWSLINRAVDFNDYLINREEFAGMLEFLPIVMVDYATTNKLQFNDDIMEIIMDFNANS